MPTRLHYLHALRARLLLDQGLGVEFAPDIRHTLDQAIAAAGDFGTPPKPGAFAPPPQPPSAPTRPAGLPQAPIAPEVPRVKPIPPAGTIPSIVPEIAASPANLDKENALAPFRERALSCEACRLCEKRTHVVWGEGSLDARIMFIGEGPGRDEDREGRPFVGRSGRVLTDIIEKGMKLPRGAVYIANVVKCRPPGNREPRPDEVAACSVYLEKQIEVINPEVVVAVGGVAGCALLGLPPKTSGLRGKWHQYRDRPLRVIYHPSYLLRQRAHDDDRTRADRDTWKDILEVMGKLAPTP